MGPAPPSARHAPDRPTPPRKPCGVCSIRTRPSDEEWTRVRKPPPGPSTEASARSWSDEGLSSRPRARRAPSRIWPAGSSRESTSRARSQAPSDAHSNTAAKHLVRLTRLPRRVREPAAARSRHPRRLLSSLPGWDSRGGEIVGAGIFEVIHHRLARSGCRGAARSGTAAAAKGSDDARASRQPRQRRHVQRAGTRVAAEETTVLSDSSYAPWTC